MNTEMCSSIRQTSLSLQQSRLAKVRNLSTKISSSVRHNKVLISLLIVMTH